MAASSGKNRRRFIFTLVAWVLIMAPGGCVLLKGEKEPVSSGTTPTEFRKYADAVSAYNAREYEKSFRQFDSMREQSANPRIARMALYGLACSRLMTAESPDNYQEALSLWEAWVQSAPPRPDLEDPVLFAPILKEKLIFSYIPQSAEQKSGSAERSIPPWLLAASNQELQRVRKQLEEANKGIDAREKKIRVLEKEISRLNEQINAFESIDQKIQKKKSAIPAD